MLRFKIILLIAALVPAFCMAAAAEEPQQEDPFAIITSMRDNYDNLNGYTAYMEKAEPDITKGDKPEKIFVKFVKQPHKVYLKWVAGPNAGREIIYIPDEMDDHFIAKLEGIIGMFVKTLKLKSDYKSPQSKYTIKQAGIGRLINSIIDTTTLGKTNNELTLNYKGVVARNGIEAFQIERLLPQKSCYPNTRLVLFVNRSTRMPMEAYAYGADGKLLEFCKYSEMKINPELSDIDFSTDNKEYGFGYL